MDHLTLQTYNRGAALASLGKVPLGNFTGQPEILAEQKRNFTEFFINGKPLSEIIDEWYGYETGVLEQWIGILGSFPNKKYEIITIKRLLKEPISDSEYLSALSQNLNKKETAELLEYEKWQTNLRQSIYCCPHCGDFYCGGIGVTILMSNKSIIWEIDMEGHFKFEFDKQEYFQTFQDYSKQINHEIHLLNAAGSG